MITKESVKKSLEALEAASPDVAKSEGDLGDANGAATGGGDGSLKAPGTDMSSAAPKGKAKKSFAKDGDGDGDADDGGDEDGDADDAEKSFAEKLPNEVKTKIDVSQFLRSLVDHNGQALDTMRKAISKSSAAQADRTEVLLDAVEGLQKSLGNIGVVLRAMCERIGVLENEPGVAKSVKTTAEAVTKSGATAVARTFEGAEGEGQEGQAMYKSLAGKAPHVQKAMISDALCTLVMKGEAKDTDVINFETYGQVPAELHSKLGAVLN